MSAGYEWLSGQVLSHPAAQVSTRLPFAPLSLPWLAPACPGRQAGAGPGGGPLGAFVAWLVLLGLALAGVVAQRWRGGRSLTASR
jgi:hypothetical protein